MSLGDISIQAALPGASQCHLMESLSIKHLFGCFAPRIIGTGDVLLSGRMCILKLCSDQKLSLKLELHDAPLSSPHSYWLSSQGEHLVEGESARTGDLLPQAHSISYQLPI